MPWKIVVSPYLSTPIFLCGCRDNRCSQPFGDDPFALPGPAHEPALPRGNDPAIPRENDRRRGGPFAIDGSSGGAGTESLRRTTQPLTPRSSPSAMPAPICRASRSLVARSTPTASRAHCAWRRFTGPTSTGFTTRPQLRRRRGRRLRRPGLLRRVREVPCRSPYPNGASPA